MTLKYLGVKQAIPCIPTGVPIGDIPKCTPGTFGQLYLVLDTAYPDLVKVGMTKDINKRMLNYNSSKPYPSAYVYRITRELPTVKYSEQCVLLTTYAHHPPLEGTYEWFSIEALPILEKCFDIIESTH